jgi:hypothetical protein
MTMQLPNNTLRGSNAAARQQTIIPSPTTPLFGVNDLQEQTFETNMAMHMWYPNQTPASTSTLSKANNQAPQVKRMLTNRTDTETRPFQSLKSAAPSWLREKPSRQKLNASSQQKSFARSRGSWRGVTAICRDNGTLLIYGEDRALVHSISLKDLSTSDIRYVCDSLFSFPNVLGIFSRSSTLHLGARSSMYGAIDRAAQTSSSSTKRQPIYLCFPTAQKMKRWRGLLRTFAKPEIYGPAQKGGTHRCHRQIDMKILEAKVAEERRLVLSPSIGAFGASLDDSDIVEIPPALGLVHSPETLIRRGTDESIQRKMALQQIATNTSSKDGAAEKGNLVEGENSDEDDSDDIGMTSGPISGLSGRERILEGATLPFASTTSTNYEMERKISDGINAATPSCYCLVWMSGELIAQTKMCNSSFKSMTWFDKFSLRDLPTLTSIQIEVMQSGGKGKSGVLGTVNLPIETMRRGESIEGWFPIWASRARETETASSSSPIDCVYNDEMVGEIKIDIKIAEETVLPLKKYAAVEEALSSNNHLDLITSLCKHLEEDQIISHLVDIYASKGAIVEHLKQLTVADSTHFDENPALLFRSNTLLTRAIDKYQRLYCRDWLDSCIGLTVRRVCQNQIGLEASDSTHHYLYPITSQDSSSVITSESNLDALLRLCRDLWANIYRNRQRCPPDLRKVLYHIRTKVNERFRQSDTQLGPGIQGVGAFVFLRLICPAITTPHLYGLMGSSPSAASSKTLMLIAKVFLALANKRVTFDKDKEPWLGQANDFLTVQAPAFDDFITFVSTEAPGNEDLKEASLGDEMDYDFQKSIKSMSKGLPVLHREALPSQDYMLDRALALAGLVSYVVRDASIEMPAESQQYCNGEKVKERENLDRYQKFVDLCCEVEAKTGIYIDRAGYNPDPIDFHRSSGADGTLGVPLTQVYTSVGSPSIASSANSDRHNSVRHSQRGRRATVSGTRLQNGDGTTSHTSSTSSAGKEASVTSREKQPPPPVIFLPKTYANPARQTLEFEEEAKGLLGIFNRGGRTSIDIIGKSDGRFGADQPDEKMSGRPSSLRKVKRSWWKRL